ncbi:MAG: FecR domain-containing protein [Sphingomonas sp.]|uniref:FecR family protein n=1 Tax=Sphingomonas sp. TaxID=28214 RepID=UPI001B002B8C|nr:FecR domain-containing protein [Sphingomonas sp.]MBO9621690.1 FecR domain-containing protein [Sphingomonas sp.]
MSRHSAIEDKALDWLIRRDEPGWSEDDQAELDEWLQESMANRAAWLRAEHGWAQADRVRSLGDWDHGQTHGYRRSWWPPAIAASLLLALGIGGYSLAPEFIHQPEAQQARFDTPIGGHKIISLADGSRIELNTQSVVRTAIGETSRDVWLDSGEAYFEVRHRAGEPFVVHAGSRTITVLGTKFSVRRDGDRVTVNVVEGRVRVDDSQQRDTSAAIITAGDTAITRGGSTLIAAKSEERVESALAWRDGMLTFNLNPLSEVAAEFNRYNRTQLEVDPSAASIPIGGTFQASNVDAFARLLHDAYGLRIEQDGERVRISE